MIEAIKKGFTIAGKNLKLVLIVYVVGAAFGLISLPFARQITPASPGELPELSGAGGLGVVGILSILVQLFVMGGVLGCVQDVIKKGAANISEFITFGKKFYIRLLLSGLLGFVIGILYSLLIMALIGGVTTGGTAVKIFLGLLLAISSVFGVALILMLIFWPYAIVTEDIGAIAGLKKSIAVATKPLANLFRLLLLGSILFLITFLVNLVISLPQVVFAQAQAMLNLYRILIVGAAGAFLNVALVSALMAYYFTLKGGGAASQGEAPSVV